MAFSFRDLFFGGTKFCCCLPVRIGVIIMAVLGLVISGVLSILLWYEVSTGQLEELMTVFVIGGLVETFLFVASVLGLVGAIVRKQTFVQIYAILTYIHFVLNVAIAIWLLVMVARVSDKADSSVCNGTSTITGAQSQCKDFLRVGEGTIFGIAIVVLMVEIYGAVIVTRYVNQLKREKSYTRQSRSMVEEAFKLNSMIKGQYSLLHKRNPSEQEDWVMNGYDGPEFDPYREVEAARPANAQPIPPPVPPMPMRQPSLVRYNDTAALPIAVGYGGGTWTHQEISDEEKRRLQRQESEFGLDMDHSRAVDGEEAERRLAEVKLASGPPATYESEVEELPRYTDSDREITGSMLA